MGKGEKTNFYELVFSRGLKKKIAQRIKKRPTDEKHCNSINFKYKKLLNPLVAFHPLRFVRERQQLSEFYFNFFCALFLMQFESALCQINTETNFPTYASQSHRRFA